MSTLFDRISFWSVFATIVFLPIFFVPFVQIPVEISKSLLLVSGLTISIVAWVLARFSDGKVRLPKSKILLAGLVIVLVTFFSAYFSKAQATSFFGLMFDVGTFWFMLAAFLFMLFASLSVHTEKQAKITLHGFLISSSVVLFFQASRYFLPDSALSFGILRDGTSNLFGSWNSFGFFAGLILLISVFILELSEIRKNRRLFLYALIALSIFNIMAVNLALIWEIVGVFSILLFIVKIMASPDNLGQAKKKSIFPAFAFGIALLALFFFLTGRQTGNLLPQTLGLSNTEISPSFTTTLQVGKSALTENPFFGIGANRFLEIWAKWKPIIVNETQFLDAIFNSGSSFLLTMFICTGVLGALAWLGFIFLLVYDGGRLLLETIRRKLDIKTSLLFVISIFWLAASFLYSMSTAGIMLAFGFTGVFIGQLASARKDSFLEFNFLKDPRTNFFVMFFLVVIMIGGVGFYFKFVQRFTSVFYFNKTLSTPDPNQAEALINKAISLNSNDMYFRTYSEIKLARLITLYQKKDPLTAEEEVDLQNSFVEAERTANQAVVYNPHNYLNHKMLGTVYTTAGKLGMGGAPEKAIEAYLFALKLNPLNPGLRLLIAREYIALGQLYDAEKYAQQAFELAPRYIESSVLLSEIKSNINKVEK